MGVETGVSVAVVLISRIEKVSVKLKEEVMMPVPIGAAVVLRAGDGETMTTTVDFRGSGRVTVRVELG